jgi:hypothetical protein
MVYNSYLRFYCLALLKADFHILFTVANAGDLADALINTVIDPKGLRWVIPRIYKRV